MKPKCIAKNLSGADIIELLKKGHMIRRSCWMKDFYIRICNERGFDADGDAIFNDRDAIRTISTEGYFMHLAHSSQPYAEVRVWKHANNHWLPCGRDGEGIQILWATDWEDYGFINRADWDLLTEELKKKVRAAYKRLIDNAIKKAIIDSREGSEDKIT